ncbi:MAG: hypothetical protein JO363_14065 [Solirubrobacterales bacterium]|nr:hypothetical protein [Solirubrobacterales bacterium]
MTHTEALNSVTHTEVLRQSVAGRGRRYSQRVTAKPEDHHRPEHDGYA